MSKDKSVIKVLDPRTEELKSYKLMSARLPEFLEAYPKAEGFQVKIETTDMLHSKPGLIKLYEAAIAAGMPPNQAGLPPLPDANVVIFTAHLIDKDGKILESASATRHLTGFPKEWEKGETSARQRLIAALGFGGDCFDEDERSDISKMNQKNGYQEKDDESASESDSSEKTEEKSDDQDSEPESSDESKSDNAKAASQASDAPSKRNKDGSPRKKPGPKPKSKTKESPEPENADSSAQGSSEIKEEASESTQEKIPANIVRQIAHQAQLKNVEIQEYKTVVEARAELKRLMRL